MTKDITEYEIFKVQKNDWGYRVSFYVSASGGFTTEAVKVSNKAGLKLKEGGVLPKQFRGTHQQLKNPEELESPTL